MTARLQFSVAGLLVSTFWLAVLLAIVLAMWRIYGEGRRVHWFETEKLGKQILLNLALGTAIGGWTGGLRWPGTGMVIGFFTAGCITALWVALLAITAAMV